MTDLTERIAEIEAWDRSQCLQAWVKLTGQPPVARLSTRFLRRALIFELQCKELGGHTASVKRVFRAHANSEEAKKSAVSSPAALARDTQLVREWNGRIYRVNVAQDGFEMDGRQYASLSAVAKQITGAQWSGPRFFGLNGKST